MSDNFLPPEEVERITKREQHPAQVRMLIALGYKKGEHFILASDGEPLVFRNKLDTTSKTVQRQRQPHRWERLAGVKQLRP